MNLVLTERVWCPVNHITCMTDRTDLRGMNLVLTEWVWCPVNHITCMNWQNRSKGNESSVGRTGQVSCQPHYLYELTEQGRCSVNHITWVNLQFYWNTSRCKELTSAASWCTADLSLNGAVLLSLLSFSLKGTLLFLHTRCLFVHTVRSSIKSHFSHFKMASISMSDFEVEGRHDGTLYT